MDFETIIEIRTYSNLKIEGRIMKAFIWIVILCAIVFGGYKIYKSYSPKSETQTAAAKSAVNPATTRAVFPESYTGKPNSEKGIKNWRAIKKVTNLNDQHQKDLQDNM